MSRILSVPRRFGLGRLFAQQQHQQLRFWFVYASIQSSSHYNCKEFCSKFQLRGLQLLIRH